MTSLHYIEPQEDYIKITDDAQLAEKLKEWGLPVNKRAFLYKDRKQQQPVTIVGYEEWGTELQGNTIIIQFEDGKESCIHPAYLKEMQAASFGKVYISEDSTSPAPAPVKEAEAKPKTAAVPAKNASKPKAKAAEKKLELPTDKVHFTATIKQFALSWNHFNEENDEVVVLENVKMDELEIGLAWCSHSKTLKKFELQPGEELEFDGKIVKKKLPQGKDAEEEFIVKEAVPYKINNPSKIKKNNANE